MEVRLLSRSEAMMLETEVFWKIFWWEVDYPQCWLLGCCPSRSFSETHPQSVAVSYSRSFFKKYFEDEGIVDEIRILSIKTICLGLSVP